MLRTLTRTALTAAAAAAVLTVTATSTAWADPASGPGSSAINVKRDSLNSTLYSQYFANAGGGPYLTNDGVGGFRYYTGAWGEGTIYWSPQSGAHEIHGSIEPVWKSYNYESGLGYPVTDELGAPDGVGRYNYFFRLVNGQLVGRSAIYWSPKSGAHAVYGDILASWGSNGYEAGIFGYPINEEYTSTGGWCPKGHRAQDFNRYDRDGYLWRTGHACWNPKTRQVDWLASIIQA